MIGNSFYMRCNACTAITEGHDARVSYGDETWWVCPECNTIEDMDEVVPCSCNVDKLDEDDVDGCNECEKRGWLA